MKRIRVLVVEGGRPMLGDIVAGDPGMELLGIASTGREGLSLMRGTLPDAISLDAILPDMNALQILDAMMKYDPLPVLMMSGDKPLESSIAAAAMGRGALDHLRKPEPGGKEWARFPSSYLAKLREIASVTTATMLERRLQKRGKRVADALVVIGASTGGPKAVKRVLAEIPPDFPAAVLIVQHLSAEFTDLVANGMRNSTRIPVEQVENGVALRAGTAYLTPGGISVKLAAHQGGGKIQLVSRVSPHHIQPWIDLAMADAAQVFGKRCIGVLLTGMGEDGVAGMRKIKELGGATYAQDEASSIIFGMAKEAISAGVVDHILPAQKIGTALIDLVAAWG
ncbi:MAG: chemotaxis protein CheB [Elusimicrobiota bacterium]